MIKIKKLKLDNFVKFTDFEIEFHGKITNLIGINGSGKTTVGLTAIWACLKGIAEKSTNGQLIGERYRFIGDLKKTADIELTLFDESADVEITIKNKISKDSNKITFDAPIGYKIDNEWVKNLLSVAFLSAKNFTQCSSKEQALMLGIDTKAYDDHLKDLKQDYTYVNRKIRGFGDIKSCEKVQKVSISELLAEKNKIDAHNAKQTRIDSDIQSLNAANQKIQDNISALQKEMEINAKKIIELGSTEDLIDVTGIVNKINNAEEINKKAIEYDMYIQKKSEYELIREEIESNKRNQEQVKRERMEYIKSFKFPFDELSVNDDGELLLNDRPIKDPYFSKGELEIIVAKLHAKKNPGLKVRFIDDFELLDEKNQEVIVKSLINDGFQIITAKVGDETEFKKNSVLLRESKIVEDEV